MSKLIIILLLPIPVYIFTIGRYYGQYYDNHYFNLVAMDLLDKFNLYAYIGVHYGIHSSIFSYILYPLFKILGPTEIASEIPAAIFNTLTVYICYLMGKNIYNRRLGLIFSAIVTLNPVGLIWVYTHTVLTFIIFLNTLAIYLFLTGLQKNSTLGITLAALSFSISCICAIYSLPLLLFFLIFSVLYISNANRTPENCHSKTNLIVFWIIIILSIIPIAYLILLLIAIGCLIRVLLLTFIGLVCLKYFYVNRPINAHKTLLRNIAIFFLLTISIIAAMDLFVQVDVNFLNGRFGYYSRDSIFAGGYYYTGGEYRPPFIYNGKRISILNQPIYQSIITTLLHFRTHYTKISINLITMAETLIGHCLRNLSPFVLTLFAFGISLPFLKAWRRSDWRDTNIGTLLPAIWGVTVFVSLSIKGTRDHRIVYLFPILYLYSAFAAYFFIEKFKKNKKSIRPAMIYMSIALIWIDQLAFSIKNIFLKYKRDLITYQRFALFNGQPYGRSYKEVGEFLLKDAPLKQNDKFRSALVYFIDPNGGQLFFNTIDWFTQNKIKIFYLWNSNYAQKIFGDLHGFHNSMAAIHNAYPDLEVIYFADFHRKGFRVFPEFSDPNYAKDLVFRYGDGLKGLVPFAIIDDDKNPANDCILYKFSLKR